jgi:hypothetical protein
MQLGVDISVISKVSIPGSPTGATAMATAFLGFLETQQPTLHQKALVLSSERARLNPTGSISLPGRVIDVITTLATNAISKKVTLNPEVQKENAAASLAWCESIIDFFPKNGIYAMREPFHPDVVCRNLIANVGPDNAPASTDCITNFLNSMKRFASNLKARHLPVKRMRLQISPR